MCVYVCMYVCVCGDCVHVDASAEVAVGRAWTISIVTHTRHNKCTRLLLTCCVHTCSWIISVSGLVKVYTIELLVCYVGRILCSEPYYFVSYQQPMKTRPTQWLKGQNIVSCHANHH